MTGNEILKQCVDLLGYRDAAGDDDLEAASRRAATEYINQVLLDICIATEKEYSPVEDLDSSIPDMSPLEISILKYGVCMWISFGISDAEKNALFTRLYNSKRSALSHSKTIKDVMPVPEG